MLGLPLLLTLPAERHLVELDSLHMVLVCYADHGKFVISLHGLAVVLLCAATYAESTCAAGLHTNHGKQEWPGLLHASC